MNLNVSRCVHLMDVSFAYIATSTSIDQALLSLSGSPIQHISSSDMFGTTSYRRTLESIDFLILFDMKRPAVYAKYAVIYSGV